MHKLFRGAFIAVTAVVLITGALILAPGAEAAKGGSTGSTNNCLLIDHKGDQIVVSEQSYFSKHERHGDAILLDLGPCDEVQPSDL